MKQTLKTITDEQLLTIYRIAKTKLRPFFGHPQGMIALRKELEARNLTPIKTTSSAKPD